jgi:hypothetical protein
MMESVALPKVNPFHRFILTFQLRTHKAQCKGGFAHFWYP